MTALEKTTIEASSILNNGRIIHYLPAMEQRNPVYDLISQWPTRSDLASDLAVVTGKVVTLDRVHKWAQFGSIPSGMQLHVVEAAKRRGISLTERAMLELHAAPADRPTGDAA